MIRSKLVLGFVVALGVAGLGAAAVAMENDAGGTGSIASEPTTTVVIDPSTTVPTTDAPGTGTEPITPSADVADRTDPTDPEVERSTDGCDGATYANHGDYVSSIARGGDRQPGDVSAAAQSDCAKPVPSVDGTDDGEASEPPEAPEAPESETVDAGSPGQGQGRGLGQGNG